MLKKYVVRNSKIHGRGVFASKDIKRGEKIIEYVGKKITKKESEKIAKETLERSLSNSGLGAVYIFNLDRKYDLDGNVPNNPAKYINHSCNPNAESEQDSKDRIWISALRDIKKGEELTYNYGYGFEEYEDHPCKCGSPNCQGYVLAEKHWKRIKSSKSSKQAL